MRSGNWFSKRITPLLKDNAVDRLCLIASDIKAITIVTGVSRDNYGSAFSISNVQLYFNPNKDPICQYICK